MKCRTLVVFYGPEEGTGAPKSAAAPASTETQAAPAMPQGGNIRRAEALGDVTVVSKDQNASGDLGVYDMKTKTITLTGNVVVSQGKNVVTPSARSGPRGADLAFLNSRSYDLSCGRKER